MSSSKKKSNINSFLIIGAVITGILLTLVLVGIFWTPYDPFKMDGTAKLQAPSLLHLLGTDKMGRDILSRVMSGMSTSFFIAICVVAIATVFGTLLGGLCGYFGGVADAVVTRLCDTISAFPAILLALVIISIIGGGVANLIIVQGILFIPSFTRVARTEFARSKSQNYIQSAKLMGAGNFRIIFRHIMPNTVAVMLPTMIIGFNNAILSESSMSFLGIGVLPPQPSLGSMLSEAQLYIQTSPTYAIVVGATIAILILGLSMLGEGLMQALRRE